MRKKIRQDQIEAFVDSQRQNKRSHLVAQLESRGFEVKDDGHKIHVVDQAGGAADVKLSPGKMSVTTGENRTTDFFYSKHNKLNKIVDPGGLQIHYDYDSQGRLNSIQRGNHSRYQFEYDDGGDVSRVTHPDRKAVQIQRTATTETCTLPGGSKTTIEFDENGLQTAFVDGNGHRTESSFGGLNSPTGVQFPNGSSQQFQYSAAARLEAMAVNGVEHANYQIGDDNVSANFSDGTFSRFQLQSGQIVKAENENGTIELVYDSSGQVIEENANGVVTKFERDALGNLTAIITPRGQQLEFHRDNEHRVTQIVDWCGGVHDVDYHLNNALAGIAFPNHVAARYGTSEVGLMASLNVQFPSSTADGIQLKWKYDQCDRLIEEESNQKTFGFKYDDNGRLTQADSLAFGTQQFRLDPAGNTVNFAGDQCDFNAVNQLVAKGDDAFGYDDLGNLVSGSSPMGTSEYKYNGRGQLIQSIVNGQVISYRYDAFGRRIEKAVGNLVTQYIWAGQHLLSESVRTSADDQEISVTDYLHVPDCHFPVAMLRDGNVFYFHNGRRGEPLAMSDSSGKIVWRASYDAYGRIRIELEEESQPWRLAGQYHDVETGLYYVTARYYSPELGRFLSMDPLRFGGGSENFYAYCDADPINKIDPTGEFIFTAIIVGAVIGAAIGAGISAYTQKRKRDAARAAGQPVPDYDWGEIGKAALIGGVVGAVGGGVGAAVEGAVAATTLAGLAGAGAVSGGVSSVAEQCVEMAITGKAPTPGEFAKKVVIATGIGTVTGPLGGLIARRLSKGGAEAAEEVAEEVVERTSKQSREIAEDAVEEAAEKITKNTSEPAAETALAKGGKQSGNITKGGENAIDSSSVDPKRALNRTSEDVGHALDTGRAIRIAYKDLSSGAARLVDGLKDSTRIKVGSGVKIYDCPQLLCEMIFKPNPNTNGGHLEPAPEVNTRPGYTVPGTKKTTKNVTP